VTFSPEGAGGGDEMTGMATGRTLRVRGGRDAKSDEEKEDGEG